VSMHDRIIGLEVEYNLAHQPAPDQVRHSAPATSSLAAETVWQELVPGARSPFWPTGCKLYCDQGHLEWASQECRGPREALAADKAGERLLAQIAAATERRLGGRIVVAKNNLDPQGNTFGCHENYSLERRGRLLADDGESWEYLVRRLVPFLVSRLVMCGSGCWAPGGRPGFDLSQRAARISQVVTNSTISGRSIVNSRDEAHADRRRFRRLHLILGDANIAEIAGYLKLGTTSLVLEMIEEAYLGEGPEPADPVAALHAFSADARLRTKVPLAGGGQADAIDLQSHYLSAARGFFGGAHADGETLRILDLWEEVLAKLREDPAQLFGKLDWVTKRAVLQSVADSQGFDDTDPRLAELDLDYHGVRRNGNLLSVLESGGVFERLLDDSEIERAASEPPPFSRARVRAAAMAHGWTAVDWTEIRSDGTTLMLNDPFDWCPVRVLAQLGLGTAELSSWLATGLAADRPAIRIQALQALAGDGTERTAALALQALRDGDPEVRAAAAAALAPATSGPSREALEGALADPHFLVRLRAGEALAAGHAAF